MTGVIIAQSKKALPEQIKKAYNLFVLIILLVVTATVLFQNSLQNEESNIKYLREFFNNNLMFNVSLIVIICAPYFIKMVDFILGKLVFSSIRISNPNQLANKLASWAGIGLGLFIAYVILVSEKIIPINSWILLGVSATTLLVEAQFFYLKKHYTNER